jgi:predicted MPP superfamily phosphohydrolase
VTFFGKRTGSSRTGRRRILVAVNILLWALACVVIYARWIEPNRIKVERVPLPEHLAKSAAGELRIVHLADLHISRVGAREERLVRTVNSLDPDLILITGDLSQFYRGTEAVISVLSRLTPRSGTFAVLGDADYSNKSDHCRFCHAGKGPGLRGKTSWQVLRNEEVLVETRGGPVLIAGADDPTGPCGNSIPAAPAEKDRDTPILRILLSASPLVLPRAAGEGYDLVLAGDTHGGQVRIPFLGPVSRDVEGGEYGYDGWVSDGGTEMFINRGFGTSYLPYRLSCPPLVAVFDWTSRSSGQ